MFFAGCLLPGCFAAVIKDFFGWTQFFAKELTKCTGKILIPKLH